MVIVLVKGKVKDCPFANDHMEKWLATVGTVGCHSSSSPSSPALTSIEYPFIFLAEQMEFLENPGHCQIAFSTFNPSADCSNHSGIMVVWKYLLQNYRINEAQRGEVCDTRCRPKEGRLFTGRMQTSSSTHLSDSPTWGGGAETQQCSSPSNKLGSVNNYLLCNYC